MNKSEKLQKIKAVVHQYDALLVSIKSYGKGLAVLANPETEVVLYIRDSGNIQWMLEINKELGHAFYEGKIKDLQEQARELEKRMEKWK